MLTDARAGRTHAGPGRGTARADAPPPPARPPRGPTAGPAHRLQLPPGMRAFVPIGRVLFALIFVASVVGHFTSAEISEAAAHGVPLATILVPLAGLIALVGGVSVMLGYRARFGALLLLVFLVPVTLVMHKFWGLADPQMAMMQKVKLHEEYVVDRRVLARDVPRLRPVQPRQLTADTIDGGVRSALPAIAVACAATLAACGPTPPAATGCAAQLLPGDLVITEVFADFQAAEGGRRHRHRQGVVRDLQRERPRDRSLGAHDHRTAGSMARGPTRTRSARRPSRPRQFFTLGNAAPGRGPRVRRLRLRHRPRRPLEHRRRQARPVVRRRRDRQRELRPPSSPATRASSPARSRRTTRSTTTRTTGARPTTPSSRPATSARRAPTTTAGR